MPGTENTVSTSMEPASRPPNRSPTMVSTGISAFLNACLMTMTHREIPRDLEVRM